MPHVKIAKKSTDTDMTPFVDIAFLILSFFIMATKFKPEEPIKVETPGSVSSDILAEENSMLITI
ncbi:MAG TPA: biopolymer transporter ExbD, partial [Chitinophagaceae bacterium]|nr:biopolymer transporter ExbD [Chitinophagaceae bacterium]